MISRCFYERDRCYKHYGGRGITVCDRWRRFANFLEDMGDRPAGTTLSRKDNDGSYCKENCCWQTPIEQNRNKRSNVLLRYGNFSLTAAEWAERLGVPAVRIEVRRRNGWPV